MGKATVVGFIVLFATLFQAGLLRAEGVEPFKPGVVRITAKEGEITKEGTGFIVSLKKDRAYIVTAAHVVRGDKQPMVEVFTNQNVPVHATVIDSEGGGDTATDLALLMVRGQESLLSGLIALSLAPTIRLSGGEEDVRIIGFPRGAGPWAVLRGSMTSIHGRKVVFDANIDEGNSGGPMIQNGQVVGLVAGRTRYGLGVTAGSVQDYLNGHRIFAQEPTPPSVAKVLPTPSVPVKPETRQTGGDHQIIGQDGAPMVLIPAGEFWMGSPDDEGTPNEHPRHWVYLEAYDMDKFEVTVSRYAEFLQSTGRQAPHDWAKVKISKHSNLPVVGVSWNDAETYCRWAGKRLPTEAEWEKAARGTDERTYPWGDKQPSSGLANFGKTHTRRVYDERLAPVESYEAGNSPYGLHHMAGNVYEWTADWYDEDFYAKSPQRKPTGPSNGQYRMLRGGSWLFKPIDVRSAHRSYTTPTNQYDYIGFRCAQDSRK